MLCCIKLSMPALSHQTKITSWPTLKMLPDRNKINVGQNVTSGYIETVRSTCPKAWHRDFLTEVLGELLLE